MLRQGGMQLKLINQAAYECHFKCDPDGLVCVFSTSIEIIQTKMSPISNRRSQVFLQASWNHMEQGLLGTALVIIILTSFCLANENHWAHSESWTA